VPEGNAAHLRGCLLFLWHLMPDHVHIMISILPKYAISQVVGYIKGKSAIHVARRYFASTVGSDEQIIREYVRHQEKEDRRVDQLKLM